MDYVNRILKPTIVVAMLTSFIGFSIWLRKYESLSEASFMVLVTLSAILSVLIPNLNQVKSFSISKGELVLQEMKETEASVKELAKAIVEVQETGNHGIMLESYDSEAHDMAIERLRKLAT
jgi:competence protein ComGC